jgi:hypothetical protein
MAVKRVHMKPLLRFWPLALYGLVILHFCLSYCGFGRAFLNLDNYLTYTERMPYQGRVLPALVFNSLHGAGILPSFGFGKLLAPAQLPFFFAATALSLAGAVAAVRDIVGRHLGYGATTREASAMALLLSCYFTYLVGYEMKYFLPYDLPSLGLWAAVLWLAFSRKSIWLVVVFALATLNRETSIILILCVLAIYHHHNQASFQALLALALPMALIWLVTKYGVYQAFNHNPSDGNGLALNHFMANVRFVLSPLHWPQLGSIWSFLWLPLLMYWSAIKAPLQVAFKRIVLLTLAILMVTGIVIEIRIFGELGLLVVICLAGVLDGKLRALSPQRSSTQVGLA